MLERNDSENWKDLLVVCVVCTIHSKHGSGLDPDSRPVDELIRGYIMFSGRSEGGIGVVGPHQMTI